MRSKDVLLIEEKAKIVKGFVQKVNDFKEADENDIVYIWDKNSVNKLGMKHSVSAWLQKLQKMKIKLFLISVLDIKLM